MDALCEGRIVVVTGAGRGIGRAHALELAGRGARVVVNDRGSGPDGTGSSDGPAGAVVDAIRAAGGEAVANGDDVSDWEGARNLIETAIGTFGGLDVVVNNAGILRDRMLVNMSPDEWDDVVRVHLRGTVAPMRWAADHWRGRFKAGHVNAARIINTTSGAGLYGNPGQSNYGAAKAAIAGLTLIAAMELQRYGVTVNAIAPIARTRLNPGHGEAATTDPDAADSHAPEHVSPLVAWLSSTESGGVTGRVFNVSSTRISIADGWRAGTVLETTAGWQADALGRAIDDLVTRAAPRAGTEGLPPGAA